MSFMERSSPSGTSVLLGDYVGKTLDWSFVGGIDLRIYQAVEEKVVVVSHGGVVEQRRHLGALGVLLHQLLGVQVGVDGVWSSVN